MKSNIAFVVLAMGTLLVLVLHNRGRTLSDECARMESPVTMLLSEDHTVCEQAQRQITREHEQMVRDLCDIVNEPRYRREKPSAVRRAIVLLGELRSPIAIPVLVENIGFPYLEYPKGNLNPDALMTEGDRLRKESPPAVNALVAIGDAAAPTLIEKLRHSRHEIEYKACQAALFPMGSCEVGKQVSRIMAEVEESKRKEAGMISGESLEDK